MMHYKQTQGGEWRVTCKAHRSDGHFCTKFPIKGGVVCGTHGGQTPRVREAAQRRWSEWETLRKVTRGLTSAGFDLRNVDPIEELLWAVAVSSQAVKWLAYQIAELKTPDPNVTDSEIEDLEGIDDEGNPVMVRRDQLYTMREDGSGSIHPLWTQWNLERSKHAKFAKMAVDAGVSERMVRIAEAQSEMVVETLIYALDNLGLSFDIKERATELVAQRFRELDAQMAPLGAGAAS